MDEAGSDLFKESDDILAHVSQTDNDVVVVDVAQGAVVSALPPRLIQHQTPAVHSGQEVLVLPGAAEQRPVTVWSLLFLRDFILRIHREENNLDN